jgi:hypothetical protein
MTTPGLFDLQPTDAELDALDEVLAEVYGEADGLDYGGDDEDLDGPWHDQAELANAYSTPEDQLAAIGGMIDLAQLTEAQRIEEDAEPLPVKAEDRIAHLMDRASRHTYTPPAAFRDATDLANGDPGYGCGIYDADTGRCTARYHSGTCIETTRQSAATSDHEAASQWKDTLMASTATAVELATAHRYTEGVDDWLADPARTISRPTRRCASCWGSLAASTGLSRCARLPRSPRPNWGSSDAVLRHPPRGHRHPGAGA